MKLNHGRPFLIFSKRRKKCGVGGMDFVLLSTITNGIASIYQKAI